MGRRRGLEGRGGRGLGGGSERGRRGGGGNGRRGRRRRGAASGERRTGFSTRRRGGSLPPRLQQRPPFYRQHDGIALGVAQDHDAARAPAEHAVEDRGEHDIAFRGSVAAAAARGRRGSGRRDAAAGDPHDVEVPQRGVEEQLGGRPGVGAGEDDGRGVGTVVGGAVGEGLRVGAAALELALERVFGFFCFEVVVAK